MNVAIEIREGERCSSVSPGSDDPTTSHLCFVNPLSYLMCVEHLL